MLMPRHPEELPGGPRIGPISRSGYEIAPDAAGNPFLRGEAGDRICMTVDSIPGKRSGCLLSFDRSGAFGAFSPRTDVRSLHIDDAVRRARSEPPKPVITREGSVKCLQAFGLGPSDLPEGLRHQRRCLSPDHSAETRNSASKTAVGVKNIEGVVSRKHFVGENSPRSQLSPRLAAKSIETMDIDSHPGRGRAQRGSPPPAKQALPLASSSYEINSDLVSPRDQLRFAPRNRSLKCFAKAIDAEGYARTIGRPPAVQQQLSQIARALRGNQMRRSRSVSATSVELNSACSWSMVSSEPTSPGVVSRRKGHRLSQDSNMSTNCSDEGGSWPVSPSSPASRPVRGSLIQSLADMAAASFDLCDGEPSIPERLFEDVEDESENGHECKVPYGLKRVVSSLMPSATELRSSKAHGARAAVEASMLTMGFQKNQGSLRRAHLGGGSKKAGPRPVGDMLQRALANAEKGIEVEPRQPRIAG